MLIVAITLFVASYTLCTSFFELNGFQKNEDKQYLLLWHRRSKSYNKYIIAVPWVGQYGEIFVLRLCIVPPCGRANTATLELNIFPYCPPSHAIMLYVFHPYYSTPARACCKLIRATLSQPNDAELKSSQVCMGYTFFPFSFHSFFFFKGNRPTVWDQN